MDVDVKQKLDDLEKRIKHQEDIHPNLDLTKEGIIHGVSSNLPQIIATVLLSVSISGLLFIYFNKSIIK